MFFVVIYEFLTVSQSFLRALILLLLSEAFQDLSCLMLRMDECKSDGERMRAATPRREERRVLRRGVMTRMMSALKQALHKSLGKFYYDSTTDFFSILVSKMSKNT